MCINTFKWIPSLIFPHTYFNGVQETICHIWTPRNFDFFSFRHIHLKIRFQQALNHYDSIIFSRNMTLFPLGPLFLPTVQWFFQKKFWLSKIFGKWAQIVQISTFSILLENFRSTVLEREVKSSVINVFFVFCVKTGPLLIWYSLGGSELQLCLISELERHGSWKKWS